MRTLVHWLASMRIPVCLLVVVVVAMAAGTIVEFDSRLRDCGPARLSRARRSARRRRPLSIIVFWSMLMTYVGVNFVLATGLHSYGFGRSSVAQLDHIGLLGPRLACAHAVHVSAPDIDRLAATGTVVVHNPVSNMRLGSGIAPLPAFLAAGVAVALGTDGAASNDTQNPWEVIKLAALLPRLAIADATAWPSTATILALASCGGHRVSGLAAAEPRAGTIADGAPADLLVFDDDPLAQLDQGTAEANLVFGSPAHRPRHVIARGRVLMRDRSLTTIDEDDLRDRLRAHRRELAA